jgi:hypothetical protein
MANAKLEWTQTGSGRQSYTLPVNFTWDYQELGTDDSDRERALDGTVGAPSQIHRHSPERAVNGAQTGPGGDRLLPAERRSQDLHGALDQRPGFSGGVAGLVVREHGPR